MNTFSRRRFLAAAAVLTGIKTLPLTTFAADKAKPQIGVQLYSIRGLGGAAQRNGTLPELFGKVKELGYAGVEFAGYYGKPAKELKKLLDDSGLQACGTHIGFGDIQPNKIAATIEFNQELGNKYLVVPGGIGGNEEKWKSAAEVFSKAAETAKKSGMSVGYHNHQHEFKEKFADGQCPWDVFFSNAAPEVFMQMDIGHCVAAGEDPVFWFKKFPDRINRTVHAKEVYGNGYSGVLGQYPEGGKHVDWDAVFPVLESGGLQWYIVESEAHSDTYADIEGCVKFLKSKGGLGSTSGGENATL